MGIFDKPLISVLMPVYNVVPYVHLAIESILKQTHHYWELIIVDDCSTDGTYEKALSYTDNRIKIFRRPHHQGIVACLNSALSQARGSFVARMDGDDVSLPNRFDSQLIYLSNNANLNLVGSDHISIDKNGQSIKQSEQKLYGPSLKEYLFYGPGMVHGTFLGYKKVFDHLKGYRFDTAEDYDFLTRLHTSNINFDKVPEVLYRHRRRLGATQTDYQLNLVQVKTHLYVRKLYLRRLERSEEQHDEKKYHYYLKSFFFTRFTYHLGAIIRHRASLIKSRWGRYLGYAIASFFSPYIFYWFYLGFYGRLMKSSKKNNFLLLK